MQTRARDIMSPEILTVQEGTTVEEAIRLMINSRITGLPVVDPQGRMIGMFSEYDAIVQAGSFKALKSEAFQQPIRFSREVRSVTEEMPLDEVIRLFIDSKYRRYPVVNLDGKPVGIITRRDLIRLFYYRARLS